MDTYPQPGVHLPPEAFGPPAPVQQDWRRPARIGALVAAGTVALRFWNPSATHIPLCPLQAVTGLDCPFCGGLRATHSLAVGNISAAFNFNFLLTALAPVAIVCWVIWIARTLNRPIGLGRIPQHLPAGTDKWLGAAFVVFFLVRNLPQLGYLHS